MPLLKAKSTNAMLEQAHVEQASTPEQTETANAIKKNVEKALAKETMSKADWHDKDVRISRQGLYQACLQSVGLLQLNTGNTLEDYLKLVEQAAERGLEFVNRKA